MSSHEYFETRSYGSSDRITYAVQRLILVCTAVFAVQLLLDIPFGRNQGFSPPGGFIVNWLAFEPSAFAFGALWKPFTYMFLHGGLMHLFLNMLWLYFFGPDVERALGTRQFVQFYVVCGMLGVLATFFPMVLGGGDVNAFVDGIVLSGMKKEMFLYCLVEDPDVAHEMEKVIAKKISGAHEVTLAEVDARPLPAKLRDAVARLFSPYL